MTEIAKGILGGSWNLILGWILPSSLGLTFFGLMVLPSLNNLAVFDQLSNADVSDRGIILLIASIVLGLALASLATPLYRVLEGYLFWPTSWVTRRIAKHVESRKNSAADVTAARKAGGRLDLRGSLALERFRRYPDDASQVAPTLLGNAIRRFEYYSYDRYQMSSQLMWNQLRGAAGEALVKDADSARAGVDFFICLLFVSVGVSFSSLLALLSEDRQSTALIVAAVVAALVAVACYYLAVLSTDAWASAIRAMVDMGRAPLAKGLGLELPKTLAEEREMWQQVGWFLGYAFNAAAVANLDPYRAAGKDKEEDAGE